jgi:hypothetical protein
MSSPFALPFMYQSMLQATSPYSSLSGAATTATTTSTTATAAATARANAAAPYAFGASPAQLGLLMLATQNNGGVGSGQMSGARTAPQKTATARTPATSRRRTPSRPGGLASRYFNRATAHSPYPQSYFNRQSRYFP